MKGLQQPGTLARPGALVPLLARAGAFVPLLAAALAVAAALEGTGCKKKAPEFHREFAQVSLPQAGVLPYFRGTVMDPYWPKDGRLPADLRGMRAGELVGHSGRAFPAEAVRGRYTLVNFFYATCSGICPVITSNVRRLSAEIREQSDLQFLSITVNPELDDPKSLRQFRDKYGIQQDNWTFLTGERQAIETLAREQFAGEVQTREGKGNLVDFVHTENLFLLDRQGYLRGIYRMRGTGEFARLKRELATLREADRRLSLAGEH